MPLPPKQFRQHVFQREFSRLGADQPPTGIGGFHARYTPRSGELLITTKMYMTYTPSDTSIEQMGIKTRWITLTQREFEESFTKNTAKFWSGKRVFQCQLANYTQFDAKPTIKIEFVTAPEAAHFEVEVLDGGGQSHLTQDGTLKLYSLDIHSMHKRKAMEGARKEKEKLGGLSVEEWTRREVSTWPAPMSVVKTEGLKLARLIDSKISFDSDDSISQIGKTRLGQISAIIRRCDPDDPQFPIQVTGSYLGAEGAPDGERRAKAVRAVLKRNGVKRDIMIDTQVGTVAQVTVGIKTEMASLQNVVLTGKYKYRYTILDHEFGHVLGLPDEYMLYTNPGYKDAIRNAHTAWVGLCNNAVVPPNPHGDGLAYMTNSIMSHGTVISDCHYVTMHDCLRKMTDIDQWRITTR
jgi:hypothetical protein